MDPDVVEHEPAQVDGNPSVSINQREPHAITDAVVTQHDGVTDHIDEQSMEPPTKVPKLFDDISPTVPYDVREDCDTKGDKKINWEGLQFLPVPSDAEIEKMICEVIQSHVRDEYGVTIMPFAVSCLTSRWVHIGWIRDDATVWQIIRAVWPFAQGKWIVEAMCGKQVASFSDRPESLPFRIVKIRPATVLVGVRVPVVDQKRVFEASILTTVGHIIMEMALLLNVPKESLIMTSHGVILDSGSFVLGIDNLENLEIRWKPLVSIPQFPMITDESSNPAEKDPANVQSENDYIRFAVTHPVWGSIRTVPVSRSSTIHDAIKLLLPDWPIQSRFPVAVDGKFVDSTVLVEWVMHGKKLVIEGCGNKPSPPIEVEIVHGSLASDDVGGHGSKACATFSRYVRSPFKIQAEWMKFQGDTTLLTIGAGFMTKCKSMQSIAVTINGRGVDPRLRAKDINDATIIAFRIMPLVGGAKDDIQSVLSKTLTSRSG